MSIKFLRSEGVVEIDGAKYGKNAAISRMSSLAELNENIGLSGKPYRLIISSIKIWL